MAKDVSQVRHEVEAARQELADTVEALMYKLNAPKRLKQRVTTKVRTAKERTTAKASDAKDQVAARVGDLGGNGHTTGADAPTGAEPHGDRVGVAGPEETLS